MPELALREVGDEAVVVMGNGPSLGLVGWQKVADWLRCRERFLSVAMLNGKAIGRSSPDYAVAVSASQIAAYRDAHLERRAKVVIPARRRIFGVGQGLAAYGEEPGVLSAPGRWPPLAAGPLAVWAMAMLGFARIYLYGLDGSAARGYEAPADERVVGWESWIGRYRDARRGSAEGPTPQLIRLWPDSERWRIDRDPLRRMLARTEVACQ